MHAFTRRGIQMAANAALASRLRAPGLERRHRIEHGGDYINLEDLELVRKSGVSLVTTPHFMYSGSPDPRHPHRCVPSSTRASGRSAGPIAPERYRSPPLRCSTWSAP